MSRPLRIEHAGGWYHITARGNERRAIFRDDRDRSHFLELLGQMTDRFALRFHCYALMDNHYHLVLELRQAHLSRALQWLNLTYSAWFNRRHERCGHLFQGRFKSILFSASASALEVSRYVHLNPVRVGRLGLGKTGRRAGRSAAGQAPSASLVQERIRALRGYRWSSYRAYIGNGPCPAWLTCGEIGRQGRLGLKAQRERYRRYVEEALRQGVATSGFWSELKEGAILGGERFVQEVRRWLDGDAQEQRAAHRLKREGVEWSALVAAVEKLKGRPWAQFRDRHGDGGRDMLLYLGRRGGLKLQALARAAGLKSYGAVAMAVKRYEQRLAQDRVEASALENLMQMLNVKM